MPSCLQPPKSLARPKKHSTTSLPNVAELLVEKNDVSSEEEKSAAAATRPPRHSKTASLPRDASLGAPQVYSGYIRELIFRLSELFSMPIFLSPPRFLHCVLCTVYFLAPAAPRFLHCFIIVSVRVRHCLSH